MKTTTSKRVADRSAPSCYALVQFPQFTGIRCLMMPYIQGRPETVPEQFRAGYEEIIEGITIEAGELGFLTIDESVAMAGKPHRGSRAKSDRAIHTEAGRHPDGIYAWGGGGWGSSHRVTLDGRTGVLLANSLDDSCAIWNATHEDTSIDGDIGHESNRYPYTDATMMRAGEVHRIGILTPHESLPVRNDTQRQFLRIVGRGVHGRESHFTENPLLVA